MEPGRCPEHHVRAALELTGGQDAHPGFGVFDQGANPACHVEQGAKWPLVDDPQGHRWGAADGGHEGHVREGDSAAGRADAGKQQPPSCRTHEHRDPKLDGNRAIGKGRMWNN